MTRHSCQLFLMAMATGFALGAVTFGGPVCAALALASDRTPTPPVEAMTPQGLLDIVEIGRMTGDGLSLSPDGRRFAVMAHQARPTADSYDIAWFVGEVRGGAAPRNIGDGGEAELFRNVQGAWTNEAAQWSPDGRSLYYRKQVDGAVQVWVSALDGSPARPVTQAGGDVTGFHLSADGRTLFYTADMPRREIAAEDAAAYRAGYRADDRNFGLLYQSRPYHRVYDRQGGKPSRWVLDLGAGVARPAAAADLASFDARLSGPALPGRTRASQVQLGDGAYKVAWLDVVNPQVNQGLTPPRRVAASRAADGSAPVICPDKACEGDFLHLFGFSDRGEVVFDRYDNGVHPLYAWRPGAPKARLIRKAKAALSDCHLAHGEAICLEETPVWPTRVVAIDLATGALRPVAEPNPTFGQWKLGRVRRLDWTSAHGVSTWGYLIYPVDYQPGRRYPLVFVQYNPDACLRGGTGDEFPTHVFSAHGMMVLCTGGAHPQNPLEHTEPDNRKLFASDYKDFVREVEVLSSFETAIQQLDREGLIDPRRVGLTGLSHGAEAVQYALVHSKAFAAAAMAHVSVDQFGYFGSIPSTIDIMLKPIGWGDPYKPSENWGYKDISLSTNAERIDTPLIIQAADREYLQAVPVFRRWRDAGKSIDLYVFDDEYHVKWRPAHRLNVYQRYVDWFDFWLNDRESDRAAKADQYALWEGFRAKECAMANSGDKAYCAAVK